MTHNMHLKAKPFNLIKNKQKRIELRLWDEKRRQMNIEDIISFENEETSETIKAKIIALYIFPTFKELYQKIDKLELGYTSFEVADYHDMDKYYSQEKQEKYGVVGIGIELL